LGRPLVLVGEDQAVPAILNTWFAGSGSRGTAIARCLFGNVNPSGKLAMTFLGSVEIKVPICIVKKIQEGHYLIKWRI
jgi:beta-glucosidase